MKFGDRVQAVGKGYDQSGRTLIYRPGEMGTVIRLRRMRSKGRECEVITIQMDSGLLIDALPFMFRNEDSNK